MRQPDPPWQDNHRVADWLEKNSKNPNGSGNDAVVPSLADLYYPDQASWR